MATLDVSQVPICAEFGDTFQVQQRTDQLSQTGRSTAGQIWSGPGPITCIGTIYPTGENSLVRQEDQQHGLKTLTIVTPYRLRTTAPGCQADVVYYRGNMFIVKEVNDYTPFGAGFVEAVCSSVESIDIPPQ
jgi:hypothetical protein